MGWDIELKDSKTGEPVQVESHQEGSNICIGGEERADMTLTFNYSPFYYQHICRIRGLRCLSGEKAKDTLKVLREAISILGTEKDENYWEATPGNAGHALSVLLSWAEANPEAVWEIC